ncbi:MAG: hypothetical protein Q8K57_17455 [Thiobacillus sp.]|nr:hypothetical protein [Thiobacillus sp.]
MFLRRDLRQMADDFALFYFANFVGVRRKLLPELAAEYRGWLEHGAPGGLVCVAGKGR